MMGATVEQPIAIVQGRTQGKTIQKGNSTIMTDTELQVDAANRAALLNQLNQLGMHPLPGSESAILAWFAQKNVTLDGSRGYLSLVQSDGNAAVPSAACETLRKERPELFAADAKRDAVSSKEDLSRGTRSEIFKAKSDFIKKFGLAMWEKLPATKTEAQRQSAPVSLDMTKSEWLSLSFSERVRLSAVLGPDAVGRIMARKG